MNKLAIAGLALVLSYPAFGQEPQQPFGRPGGPKAGNCISQYAEAPSYSAALLITTGFEIKAAIPGGLWLQKGKEVYFCNSGRAAEGEVICWKLRIPVRSQMC